MIKIKAGPVLSVCQESHYIPWWEIQKFSGLKMAEGPMQKCRGYGHPRGHRGGHALTFVTSGWQLRTGGRFLHHPPSLFWKRCPRVWSHSCSENMLGTFLMVWVLSFITFNLQWPLCLWLGFPGTIVCSGLQKSIYHWINWHKVISAFQGGRCL